MTIPWRFVEGQGHQPAFDLTDVELFGEMINLSLFARGNPLLAEIAVTLRALSLRTVDTDQANLADRVNLEGVAIVDPGDSPLQGSCRFLCASRQGQDNTQPIEKK